MGKKRGKKAKVKYVNSKNEPKKPLQSVEVIIRKKVLGEATYEQHFVVADGRRLKNIIELADALETMSEEIFSHHVNEFKNDFSSWVKDVFGEHNLAENLKSAASKADAQLAVAKSLLKELL